MRFVGRSGAPAEQKARALGVVLGLDEQFRERGVGEIVLRTREHDLRITRDLDLPRPIAAIGDRQPANLHIVLRRHDDLELRFEVAVSPPERHLLELEGRVVFIRLATNRLVARRPDVARPGISEVDEMGSRVRRAVLAPARHRQAAPRTRSAAGMGQGCRVATVRQELRMRTGRVRRSKTPQGGRANRRRSDSSFRGARLRENRFAGNALLQQQFRRFDSRVGVEPRHEDVVVEEVGQRDERHPLMVGKERAHDFRLRVAGGRVRIACRFPRPVVDRFVEAEPAVKSRSSQPREVRHRGGRINQAGQGGGVG